MADKLQNFKVDQWEADGASMVGRVFNVYDTYANALSAGATGLCSIKALVVLTGAAGAAITQVAGTTGVTVDNNGCVKFYIDSALTEFYLTCTAAGRNSGPMRVLIQ
jgi:hypothetical protein